jgi:general secretion pathway protein E
LPTQHGESLVIRVLDQSQIELTWQALGYPEPRVKEIEEIIQKPHGIFLVAGPTGSGKTTTLYTALSRLNTEDRKIITVEDPIEYALEGVNQVQVQPEIDMSFARALRAILRQDPNVVLIGEIRDEETAEIAVRAALLGRLVLSTVHTNDSLSALDRLVDLGVPPYLIAATLRGVLSQRLVRKVCTTCGGKGCETCGSSGYKGRRVASELMVVTPRGRDEITAMAGGMALASDAELRRFESLQKSAEELVARGETTQVEVDRLSVL